MIIISGKTEDTAEKYTSVLAQLDFTFEVRSWTAKGVPFSSKLYVPETHPVTQQGFCEREDEGHVLKVKLNVFEINTLANLYTTHIENRKLPSHGSYS